MIMSFSPWIFGLPALIIGIGYGILKRKKGFIKKEHLPFWNWLDQVIAVVISLAAGASIFFIQQQISEDQFRTRLINSINVELSTIINQLQAEKEGRLGMTIDIVGVQKTKINPIPLEALLINKAAESNMFSARETEAMLLISGWVAQHNLWVNYFMSALHNLRSQDVSLYQQQKHDDDLLEKAKYLHNCLNGKSDILC